MSALLITGGAGYVGSHTVRELVHNDRYDKRAASLDDLSEGHVVATVDAEIVRARTKLVFEWAFKARFSGGYDRG